MMRSNTVKKFTIYILVILIVYSTISFANGLLMPTNENYPKDFLRNTVSKVTVTIHGIIAETQVYQEFLNESYDSTDAVYSFPLPPNAKATKFLYWYKDQVYQAILKVKEQATNPGTGEGGVSAYVNNYIGRNGIKIHLKDIQPGEIQKVELSYISICEYYNGKHTYKFPLNTSQFTKHQLDIIEFNINIENDTEILSYDSPSHSGLQVLDKSTNDVSLKYVESKGYLSQDFLFSFTTNTDKMGLDFYSSYNDTSKGHFFMAVKPEGNIDIDSIYSKRIIFLVSKSYQMFGAPIAQSVNSIKAMLDKLNPNDRFNIVDFNNQVDKWQNSTVLASVDNINSGKQYLDLITTSSGSDMEQALSECFSQITDADYSNSIILFSDGLSYSRPKEVSKLNKYETGIFPIGIGNDLQYASLEMTAALNYGFVTYIEQGENILEKMDNVYSKISQPLMTQVGIEYGSAGVRNMLPIKTPSTYAGSAFYISGKFINSGESALSIAGQSKSGMKAYNFTLPFTSDLVINKFVEAFWAKQIIDALEWEIELYGETDDLRLQLIEISLQYNIRCRYTAYLADYKNDPTTIDTELGNNSLLPTDSRLSNNYPNPFNPSTTIRFFLSNSVTSQTILLKIYNILGQLVAVIDLSQSTMGWNEVNFTGVDMYGNQLPSGIYIAQLQIGNKIKNSIKMNLLK